MFSREYCEIFKNTYLEEHLQSAVSEHQTKFIISVSNQNCLIQAKKNLIEIKLSIRFFDSFYSFLWKQ